MKFVALIGVILFGVTLSSQILPQRIDYVIGPACITKLAVGRNFECRGPDNDHLSCRGVAITFISSCERIEVGRGGNDR